MLKQADKNYGCGVFAVANALNYPDFITSDRLEVSKNHGNNKAQLTRWLYDDGLDIFITAEHVTGKCFKMPFYLEVLLNFVKNDNYLPLLLTIPATRGNHMIALRLYTGYSIAVYDSCSNEIVYVFGIDEFRKLHPEIISVHSFKNSFYKFVTILK